MNRPTAALVTALLGTFVTAPRAADVGLDRLEEHLSTSTYQHLKGDPRTSQLSDDSVKAHASSLAHQSAACLESRTRDANSRDRALFYASIIRYPDVYRIEDWGTTVRGIVEKEHGLNWRQWACDDAHGPSSPECRAATAYLDISMGMFHVLFGCLAESARNATWPPASTDGATHGTAGHSPTKLPSSVQ